MIGDFNLRRFKEKFSEIKEGSLRRKSFDVFKEDYSDFRV